jgi:hypothetical protein
MSEQVPFGFECGNPECRTGIVMGEMLVRPIHAGDLVTFVEVTPGRLKCPECGREQKYTQADLREFPGA